jgi:hypothetical protein
VLAAVDVNLGSVEILIKSGGFKEDLLYIDFACVIGKMM